MSYSGLVVGGPLAGSMLDHSSNIYRHPKPEGTYEIDLRADGTPAAYQPNAFFEYCFVSRYYVVLYVSVPFAIVYLYPYLCGVHPNTTALSMTKP